MNIFSISDFIVHYFFSNDLNKIWQFVIKKSSNYEDNNLEHKRLEIDVEER